MRALQKEMPKLQRIYDEWAPRGLEIFAIGNDFEPEPWQKFIRDKGFTDWINVSDNPLINTQDSATALIYGGVTNIESLNFRTTFDVYATPKLFLLDKDKKIIAKQVGAVQLAGSSRSSKGWKRRSLILSQRSAGKAPKTTID